MSRNSLLETSTISEVLVTAMGSELTLLALNHLAKLGFILNDLPVIVLVKVSPSSMLLQI